MAQKPSIPKGTRDFNPVETARRNYIFDTIRDVFALYGYRPIETPAMENLSTLMGKYGEEGDKLLFKILNSGDWMRDLDASDVAEGNYVANTAKVSEKGLRYDLTVPFARLSCSTATTCSCRSSAVRFSRYGVPTVPRKAVIANSTSVTQTSWAPTRCSTRSSCCR